MKVLITGGAGFIGSHLVKALLERGDEIVIVDNFDPFYPERLKRRSLDGRARLLEADIRDQDAMHRAFRDVRPDAVVHLAALAGVRPSLERPAAYMDVNVRGTASLLEAARDAGTRRFVLGSSSSVYGAHAESPFRETARVDSPESPYAASKVASEVLARTFHNLYGIEVAALRFFTVYGPRQRPDLAIHKFSRRMLAGQPLPFYGDGSTRRDYTWVDDIIAGVVAACDVPLRFDVLNLGGAQTTSLAEPSHQRGRDARGRGARVPPPNAHPRGPAEIRRVDQGRRTRLGLTFLLLHQRSGRRRLVVRKGHLARQQSIDLHHVAPADLFDVPGRTP